MPARWTSLRSTRPTKSSSQKRVTNQLGADDLQGASFTLTNPGGIGTVASVPRLMAGQGAISRPARSVIRRDCNRAERRCAAGRPKVMQLTSTYDHRVIQGAQSGEYLRRVDELLQGAGGFYDALFASLGLQAAPAPHPCRSPPAASRRRRAPSDEMLRAVAAGMAIVSAYRLYGHLAAHLDPLGTEPVGDARCPQITA